MNYFDINKTKSISLELGRENGNIIIITYYRVHHIDKAINW